MKNKITTALCLLYRHIKKMLLIFFVALTAGEEIDRKHLYSAHSGVRSGPRTTEC
jgi:hypothetical protein